MNIFMIWCFIGMIVIVNELQYTPMFKDSLYFAIGMLVEQTIDKNKSKEEEEEEDKQIDSAILFQICNILLAIVILILILIWPIIYLQKTPYSKNH